MMQGAGTRACPAAISISSCLCLSAAGFSFAPVPAGLAVAVPKLTLGTPLGTPVIASAVSIDRSVPLLSLTSTPQGRGLGSPRLQIINQEQNALRHVIALQLVVQGQADSGESEETMEDELSCFTVAAI